MTLVDRIAEILESKQDADLSVPFARGRVAALIAEAAERHYRRRIETVEELRAIKPTPELLGGALIKAFGVPFLGAVLELNDDGTWNDFDSDRDYVPADEIPLPVVLLWDPSC